MAKTWVIVADSSRAHIYTADRPQMSLEELEVMDHPESRIHKQELVADKSGRAFQSVGNKRHALESDVSPKKQEIIKFAKELSHRVETGRARGEFEKLILVAAHDFLGLLRKNLSAETLTLVTREINKNLTHYPAETVREYLAERT